LSGIRTHDPSVRAAEDGSSLALKNLHTFRTQGVYKIILKKKPEKRNGIEINGILISFNFRTHRFSPSTEQLKYIIL
jgi:hypothetical protein